MVGGGLLRATPPTGRMNVVPVDMVSRAIFAALQPSAPPILHATAREEYSLPECAAAGDLDGVKQRLDQGADVNEQDGGGGSTALIEASRNGDVVFVRSNANLSKDAGPLHSLFLWLRCAAHLFSDASFIGKSDDDVW